MDKYEALIHKIAQSVAGESSHAYRKHHTKKDEFNDPEFGEPLGIKNADDLTAHVRHVLKSPDTETIHTSNTHIFCYHKPSETIVIVGSCSKSHNDGGTVFRRFPNEVKSGNAWYERMLAAEASRMGVTTFNAENGGLLPRIRKTHELYELLDNLFTDLAIKANTSDITVKTPAAPHAATEQTLSAKQLYKQASRALRASD